MQGINSHHEESKTSGRRANEEVNALNSADFANMDGSMIPFEHVAEAKQVKIEVIEGFD